MLGDVVVEETGTLTGQTELSENKVEVTLATSGQIMGADQSSEWTYSSETRPDGTVYGEGTGVMTTADGERIDMRGAGSAKSVGDDGSLAYRGAVHFHTDSEKYAALNGSVGVFEYNVAPDGSSTSTMWEWS